LEFDIIVLFENRYHLRPNVLGGFGRHRYMKTFTYLLLMANQDYSVLP